MTSLTEQVGPILQEHLPAKRTYVKLILLLARDEVGTMRRGSGNKMKERGTESGLEATIDNI